MVKSKLVSAHRDASAAKLHALVLKAHALLEAGFAGYFNLATCAHDAMPGKTTGGVAERPDDLSRCSFVPRTTCDLPVGRDTSARNPPHSGAQRGQHASV